MDTINIKKGLVMLLIVFFNYSGAQINKKTLYRSEKIIESPIFGGYNVNVLTLNENNTYKLIFQTYSSKKMAKKNILLKIEIEEGIWNIVDGFLTIIPNDKKQKLVFSLKNKNKIRSIVDKDELSPVIWKKINY
ncbi:hypothetical protein FIA58_020555 [Flavobacterium jejuense]|uniref:Uncharacterized protein n=1 Tax=Flavobacterium jejuense TaxID=1544455 RepID=A0ABX0J1L9_9FLAO|nr:hypothetical protein [Flavobacterium jejuense]NHN28076.1 hypothetical protein [Flavobacterium jejuense]